MQMCFSECNEYTHFHRTRYTKNLGGTWWHRIQKTALHPALRDSSSTQKGCCDEAEMMNNDSSFNTLRNL